MSLVVDRAAETEVIADLDVLRQEDVAESIISRIQLDIPA